MVDTSRELPDWACRLLGEDGAARVETAIAAAESRTSGEIVPILVRGSSTVGHVPLLTLTSVLLCVMLADLPSRLSAMVGGPDWLWLGATWLLAGALSIFLARLDVIRRMLTPRADQIQQVEMRAEVEFFEHGVGQTEGGTGILLFVSLMEHRAVVLADSSIAEEIDASVWQELVDTMIEGVKRQDLAGGLIRAIEGCERILTPHFPIAEGDRNELRDHLIVKD